MQVVVRQYRSKSLRTTIQDAPGQKPLFAKESYMDTRGTTREDIGKGKMVDAGSAMCRWYPHPSRRSIAGTAQSACDGLVAGGGERLREAGESPPSRSTHSGSGGEGMSHYDRRTIEASRKVAADVRRTAAAVIALVNEVRSGSSCRIARKADVSMTISGEGRARHTRESRRRAVHHALGASRTGGQSRRVRRPASGQTVLVEVVPDGSEWRR